MINIPQTFHDYRPTLETELGEPVTISGLVGNLGIFQRVCGHRHSIDDAITAWYALSKRSDAHDVLDLGTGIGTVGLALLHGLCDEAKMTCVEAQAMRLPPAAGKHRVQWSARAHHDDSQRLARHRPRAAVRSRDGKPPVLSRSRGHLAERRAEGVRPLRAAWACGRLRAVRGFSPERRRSVRVLLPVPAETARAGSRYRAGVACWFVHGCTSNKAISASVLRVCGISSARHNHGGRACAGGGRRRWPVFRANARRSSITRVRPTGNERDRYWAMTRRSCAGVGPFIAAKAQVSGENRRPAAMRYRSRPPGTHHRKLHATPSSQAHRCSAPAPRIQGDACGTM